MPEKFKIIITMDNGMTVDGFVCSKGNFAKTFDYYKESMVCEAVISITNDNTWTSINMKKVVMVVIERN